MPDNKENSGNNGREDIRDISTITSVKSEDIRDVRREKIKLLLSLGYRQTMIARELNCSQRTISYDVKQIRKGWERESQTINLDQLLAELICETNNRRRELYTIISKAGDRDKQVKISALKALGEESERIIRLMQNCGKISKDPDAVMNLQFNVLPAIPEKNQ